MVQIETEQILGCLADHVGVNRAKLSIQTGVAKIEGELSSLDLNRHSVSRGSSEIDVSPSLDSEHSQRQNFRPNQEEGCPNHSLGPTGEALGLLAGTRVGKSPNEKGHDDLRSEDRNPCFRHRLRRSVTAKRLNCASLILLNIEDRGQPRHLEQVMHSLIQVCELQFPRLVANRCVSLNQLPDS